MFYRSWKSTKFMDFRGTKHQLPYLTSGIVCFLLACRGSTGSPEEFLSDHLSLSKSGLNAVQVPPVPPGAPRPPLVPWIPLYCVSQDRPIRHVPLPPLPILIYYTPANTAVQSEALLGVHLVGVMWRPSYLVGNHNLCAQSKKLSLCPSHRQIREGKSKHIRIFFIHKHSQNRYKLRSR